MIFFSQAPKIRQPTLWKLARRIKGNDGKIWINGAKKVFNFTDLDTARDGEFVLVYVYSNQSTVEIYDRLLAAVKYHKVYSAKELWHYDVYGIGKMLDLSSVVDDV